MTAQLRPPALRWWIFLSVIGLGYFARAVFVPLVLAVFTAMLLWPCVARLQRFGASRGVASVSTLFVFTSLIGLVGWMIFASAANIALSLPQYAEKISIFLKTLSMTASAFEVSSSRFFGSASDGLQRVQVVEALPAWSGFVIRGVGSITEAVSVALFVPLLLLYFFFDKENLVESSGALLGRFVYLPKIHRELPRMVRAFVLGNVLTGLLLSVSQAGVLYLLGFSNWASLGLVSGVLNVVPLVGAPLAIALPLCQGLIQFQAWTPIAVMAAAFVSLHFVTNNVLLPLLVGKQTNVNAAALAVGLLFWSWLWGAAGFLLAIPMTSFLKIFLESHPDTLPLANLMAKRPKHLLAARITAPSFDRGA
jgi:predicted PurR-regulated permease PerM